MTITRDLQLRARQIIGIASVVAEAKASSLAPTTTHGAPESSEPTVQGKALQDELVDRWHTCTSDIDAHRFLAFAHVAVDRVKHGPRHAAETNADFTRRILADYPGVPANEVAIWEHCTVATVRRIRIDNQRHPSTGDPTSIEPVKWTSIQERRELTADLAAEGLTTREIARRIGVDQSVITRDLNRNA